MTLPANLTHAEVGAFLVAVGQHMIDHDVTASAVLDKTLLRDEEYADTLAEDLQRADSYQNITAERALDILLHLTLEEAIAFNGLDVPEPDTYKITRFYEDPAKPNETIKTGLSRDEAVAHCSSPDSTGFGWFDGFDKE